MTDVSFMCVWQTNDNRWQADVVTKANETHSERGFHLAWDAFSWAMKTRRSILDAA